ncbi:MAG: lysylphosphatidylglycerol synthase domain-containing protein [Pirellulaceae bacterium]
MRLTRIIGSLVIVVVGYFFTTTIVRNWERVREMDYAVSTEAALVVLLFVLAVMVSGLLWGRVFAAVAHKQVAATEAVRCHLASWVLKYVPGQIGGLIYKVRWAECVGGSRYAGAVAYGYELLFLTLSSTLVVIPVLILVASHDHAVPLLMAYAGLVAVLFGLGQRAPYQLARRVVQRLTGGEPRSVGRLGMGSILVFSAWFMLPRLINAVGFVVLAASMFPVTPQMYVLLGASYILAGIIGIYAFFVPSGIGVREAMIVAFASMIFPLEEAIVLSLVARLYATVADGVLGAAYLLLNRQKNEEPRVGENVP